MGLTPVSYSESVGALSCVSVIAQSCAIDKVYLSSRLPNAELVVGYQMHCGTATFWVSYFFRASTI